MYTCSITWASLPPFPPLTISLSLVLVKFLGTVNVTETRQMRCLLSVSAMLWQVRPYTGTRVLRHCFNQRAWALSFLFFIWFLFGLLMICQFYDLGNGAQSATTNSRFMIHNQPFIGNCHELTTYVLNFTVTLFRDPLCSTSSSYKTTVP